MFVTIRRDVFIACLAVILSMTANGLFADSVVPPAIDSVQHSILTNAAAIRGLAPEQAELGRPVHLHGVVTYSDSSFHSVILQDQSAGIYIERVMDASIAQGQILEVEGVTSKGFFAPMVIARSWKVLGKEPLPAPKAVTAAEMQGGQFDSQWLEVRGIVRSVTPHANDIYYLELGMEGTSLRTILSGFSAKEVAPLVDRRVRIRGVCYTKRTMNGQWLANFLGVQGAEQILLEELAPEPGSLPVWPIARLFRFPPVGTDGHRVKIRGTVLLSQPGGMTFIQDSTQAIQIHAQPGFECSPGDEVEALGFSTGGGFYPVLEEAQVRLLGHATTPKPERASITQLLSGKFGAELVQLEARLVDSVRRPEESVLILQADQQLFVARLRNKAVAEFPSLPPVGSLLRLSGVCLLPALSNWEHASPIRPGSFEILLRDVHDFVVLQRPSWWTVRRIATLLALVTGILVAAIIWVVLLRHRVIVQTRLIESKIQREATLEERTRIARELHDTLAQGFAGVAFQLEAVATHLGSADDEAREHLDLALVMVRHSLAEARRSVMNLRAQTLETGDLASALKETTQLLLGNSGVEFELRTKGTIHRLPGNIENNLLRMAQEAITNALKYSKARRILIQLAYLDDGVRLQVEDFGSGFDAEGTPPDADAHFGLRGMRERAREMNAEFRLDSQLGRGTTITVVVPLEEEFQDKEQTKLSAAL